MSDRCADRGFTSLEDFWIEGNRRVWLEDGWLYQDSDPKEPGGWVHSTVWSRTPLPADVEVEVRAEVISSSIGANNINCFLAYGDPSGASLPDTASAREDGAYAHYHNLDGYIFTFLRDFRGIAPRHGDGTPQARYRFRRCPGFEMKAERFGERCEAGVGYDIRVRKAGGALSLSVDGKNRLAWIDPHPRGCGYFGFRTFRTVLRWSRWRVRSL